MADAEGRSEAGRDMTGRPGARMLMDVAAYAFARLLLAAVLTGVIFGAAHLSGSPSSRWSWPCCSPSWWPCRWASGCSPRCARKATASIAVFDERRRTDREQLRARLRGDESPPDMTESMTAASSAGVRRRIHRRRGLSRTRRPTGCRRGSWSTHSAAASRRGRRAPWTFPRSTSRCARARAAYAALVGVPSDRWRWAAASRPCSVWWPPRSPTAPGWRRWPGEFTSTTFPFAAQEGRGVSRHRADARGAGRDGGRLRRGDGEPGAVGERRGARRRRTAGRVGRQPTR